MLSGAVFVHSTFRQTPHSPMLSGERYGREGS